MITFNFHCVSQIRNFSQLLRKDQIDERVFNFFRLLPVGTKPEVALVMNQRIGSPYRLLLQQFDDSLEDCSSLRN
jgi:hypothetical protein